ncbi:MAG: S8 family serine peptidase [Myxococcales bacterium]|nr:S8 family serine peptidase [Myxococcales bacterium]
MRQGFKISCALFVALVGVMACDSPADVANADQDRSYTIALGSQIIDTRTAPVGVAARTTGANDYTLVKFPGPVTQPQLEALAATSTIYTYLPHDTFLVRVKPGITSGLAAQPAIGASWTGPYLPEYKISRGASEVGLLAAVESRTVMVTVYPDADLPRVVAAASKLPGASLVGSDHTARFGRVRLRVAGEAVLHVTTELAAISDVFWVDVEGRREMLNDTTIFVGQAGISSQTTPIFDRGIRGEGQIVAYIDTGVDADSCYFRDPARGLPPVNACGGTAVDLNQRKVIATDFLAAGECAGGIGATEWDTQGHGSHVGATIAGDNFANPVNHDPGDGMAPAAKLVVQDAGFLTDNCGDLPGIGCPVVDLTPIFQQAFTQGARIHTNSWGDRENFNPQNTYTAACQDVDEFMFTHPDFLILFAAGNSGPGAGSVGSPSTAKNTISVGATLRGTAANSMASFSSCGPTADGRIKPDLTMPGSNIVSARSDTNVNSNNCNTASMSGTSMASPGAAGMAALVRQYYVDGNFPSGAPVVADRFTPTAALIKATMLNSTQTMTGTGTGAVPNNCQGWGRVLLDDSLFFTGQARRLLAFEDAGFPQGGAGQVKTFTVTVAAGQALRTTLAWTDFPSTPAANVNLNNDLDLTVSGPSGTFLGNVFSGSASTTGGAADRRNNVEQVTLLAPIAGTYTITVRAFNVPSSAQTFALVVSGGVTQGGGGGNRAPVANAGVDQTGTIGVQVTLDGAASSDPDGNPITFSWTQTGGPAVTLSTPTAVTARFTPTAAGTYTFQLAVSDGSLTAQDTVVVTVGGGGGPETLFSDNFETDRGWTVNASGTDTATAGAWQRANPETTTSGITTQQGTTTSGSFDLVTGALAGASAGVNDVDGGTTSIQSPPISIPAGGTVTLSLAFYFAHLNNAANVDFFRVRVVGATSATVIQELGTAVDDAAVFATRSVDISAFAGQTVRLVVEASDLGTASLIEAAVDDVLITRQ